MGRTSRNEKRKLLGSSIGAVSGSVLTYSVLMPVIDAALERATWPTMVAGVLVPMGLHLLARRALQGIEDDGP